VAWKVEGGRWKAVVNVNVKVNGSWWKVGGVR